MRGTRRAEVCRSDSPVPSRHHAVATAAFSVRNRCDNTKASAWLAAPPRNKANDRDPICLSRSRLELRLSPASAKEAALLVQLVIGVTCHRSKIFAQVVLSCILERRQCSSQRRRRCSRSISPSSTCGDAMRCATGMPFSSRRTKAYLDCTLKCYIMLLYAKHARNLFNGTSWPEKEVAPLSAT